MTQDKQDGDVRRKNDNDADIRDDRTQGQILLRFTGGPLDGAERRTDDADRLPAEYPGYAPTEQKLDPEVGQFVKVEWSGEDAQEGYYDDARFDEDRADRKSRKDADHKGGDRRTGAEKREADQVRQEPGNANKPQVGGANHDQNQPGHRKN